MNNALVTLLLSLNFLTTSPKNVTYDVHRKQNQPLIKEKINKATFLSDIIPDYPRNWISYYNSVNFSATINDKTLNATSTNDFLSKEQKNLLNSIELGTAITLNVNYRYKNSVTSNIDNHTMKISMTLVSEIPDVPEKDAEYIGGHNQLTKYIDENAINKISSISTKQIKEGTISFNINEKGEIVDVKISKTTGEPRADKLLLETISKMPKWNPAKNSMGKNIKQEYELSISQEGC